MKIDQTHSVISLMQYKNIIFKLVNLYKKKERKKREEICTFECMSIMNIYMYNQLEQKITTMTM